MAKQVVIPMTGMNAAGRFQEAVPPGGYCRSLVNAVMRQHGSMGAYVLSGAVGSGDAGYSAISGRSFEDGFRIWAERNGTAYQLETSVGGGLAGLSDWNGTSVRHVRSRDRIITTTGGSFTYITRVSDGSTRVAGISAPFGVYVAVSGAGGALENNKKVAYVATIKATEDDGYTIVSDKTFAMSVSNTSGSTQDVNVTVRLSSTAGHAAGMVVEVWKTRAVASGSTATGATYYLCGTATLTSSHVSAGAVTILDSIADNALTGAALYTNTGVEGAGQENGRPPRAEDCEFFKGSVFYVANYALPSFPVRKPKAKWGDLSSAYERASGVGGRFVTLSAFASGATSATITANPTGVVVGQRIFDAGTNFDDATYVSALSATPPVVGTTVTFSAPTTGIGLGGSYLFIDQIGIDTNGSAPARFDALGAAYLAYYTATANGLAHVVMDQPADIANQPTTQNFKIVSPYSEVPNTTSANVRINATNGANYDPPLPEYSGGTYESALLDERKNRIVFSKTDQPEHVPSTNYFFVGNGDIQRIVATDGVLWVFSSDGLYAVSGDGAGFGGQSSWSVQLVDSTFTLRDRRAVAALGRDVFAVKGEYVYRINTSGIERISDPIGPMSRTATDPFVVAADTVHNEIVVIEGGTNAYTFNALTGAWASISIGPYQSNRCAAFYDHANDAWLLPGTGNSGNDFDVWAGRNSWEDIGYGEVPEDIRATFELRGVPGSRKTWSRGVLFLSAPGLGNPSTRTVTVTGGSGVVWASAEGPFGQSEHGRTEVQMQPSYQDRNDDEISFTVVASSMVIDGLTFDYEQHEGPVKR